jgi:nucleoside-diphosphate-sugar epimerase
MKAVTLITGNMGYVGSVAVGELRAARPDESLIGVDTGWYAHCLTAEAAPERHLDAQHFADVREPLDALLDGVDAVVHLAAVSNDPIGHAYKEVTAEVNHRATVRLAQSARDAGVRSFVFASSCSMYGFAADGVRTETAPLDPLTAYARSKVAAEQDLAELADDDFVVTSLRFGTACGMSPRLRLDLVLNDFVAGAIAENRITILSDGTPWRPLIHVRDMARAIDWAIDRDAEAGGAFLAVNTGSARWNYQIRELAETVASVLDGVEVSLSPDAAPDRRSYRVGFSLFERLAPDHQPRVELEEAVRDLADGLRAIGVADSGFRDSPLVRLGVLAELRAGGLLTDDLSWAGTVRPVLAT